MKMVGSRKTYGTILHPIYFLIRLIFFLFFQCIRRITPSFHKYNVNVTSIQHTFIQRLEHLDLGGPNCRKSKATTVFFISSLPKM